MDTAKMKPIQEVLDVMPPLSPELIELGEWMKERYACRYISVLQSMLPTALKGKAERYISIGDSDTLQTDQTDGLFALLPESESEEEIIRFVSQKGEVSLQQLTRAFPDGAATIKALIGRGRLSEFQQIKDKLQKNDKSGRACRIERGSASGAGFISDQGSASEGSAPIYFGDGSISADIAEGYAPDAGCHRRHREGTGRQRADYP